MTLGVDSAERQPLVPRRGPAGAVADFSDEGSASGNSEETEDLGASNMRWAGIVLVCLNANRFQRNPDALARCHNAWLMKTIMRGM
jgi:hypothetical protein